MAPKSKKAKATPKKAVRKVKKATKRTMARRTEWQSWGGPGVGYI